MINELLNDIRELRNEMVQANWPAQRLSDIIVHKDSEEILFHVWHRLVCIAQSKVVSQRETAHCPIELLRSSLLGTFPAQMTHAQCQIQHSQTYSKVCDKNQAQIFHQISVQASGQLHR